MGRAADICGLFAFAGPYDAEEHRLRDVGELAATRGPHSHGFAWTTNTSEFLVHRGHGDLSNGLDELGDVLSAGIIGHSRLATTGTYAGGAPKIEDTMPFVVGDYAVVHNGNVRNFQAIARVNGYELASGCDSEVIAHMLAAFGSSAPELPLSVHLSMVVDRIDDGRPFVIIALNVEGEIAAMRRGLPLYTMNTDEGIYLCSRCPGWTDATRVKVAEMVSWGWPTFTRRAA